MKEPAARLDRKDWRSSWQADARPFAGCNRARSKGLRSISLAVCVIFLAGCSAAAGSEEGRYRERTPEQFRTVRDERRAYDGAPPIIPHAVSQLGRANCHACHEPGSLDNGARIAPPRSHPAWGDCRQCHVERSSHKRFRESSFEPLRWPAEGVRQSEIAPPTIPHAIQNREQCETCHIGEQARPVLRAPHGMRPNCRQCHVAAASEPQIQ